MPDEKEGYIQRSQLNFSPPKLQIDEIIEFSQLFLGIKYLWGGTTSFGYDCSGFTQMLYRQAGVLLPRNSYQQYEDIRLEQVQQGKGGDLIFFKNASFQVVHVGMLIDTNHFVHAFTKEESWICNSPLHDSRWSNGHFYHGFAIKRLTRQQTLKDWT